MSKLSEYSKFDHLEESSSSADDDEQQQQQPNDQQQPPQTTQQQPTTNRHNNNNGSMLYKDPKTGRYVFEYNGRKIYEWEQTLDEVNLYIDAPPGLSSASDIVCTIRPHHLIVGLRNVVAKPYLDEDTFDLVDTSESTWYLQDDIIHICLIKGRRGTTWECALLHRNDKNARVDAVTREEIQKQLLKERFQQEHPGFDFRDAEFSGAAPDPRTFLGGMPSEPS